jgi:O-antigen/teichoic acid export membrane protein
LSTSPGFYIKLSQRQHDTGLIAFYLQFAGLVFLALFMFVGSNQLIGTSKVLWLDLDIRYVYMAAFWGILTWMTEIATNSADAYGLTFSIEMARIAQRCVGLLIVLVLFLIDQLNLSTYFLYHYCMLVLLIAFFFWIIAHNGHPIFRNWDLSKQQIKGYASELFKYSHPLFTCTVVVMLVGILDRWLLQTFGGSIQQGFFGLSYQIGAVCFIFTSAMTSLIMREFAIAYSKNDLNEVSRLFRRFVPLLYSIAAFFGCFACVNAEKITYIFGGGRFIGASLPVAIMSLYPIHQTYGQLTGSVLLATGQTRLYRNLSILMAPLGLPLTYVMLAPAEGMGVNAGATGLAIKFVILGFVAVNIQFFIIARFLKLAFFKYLSHQILCLTCLLSIAIVAKQFSGMIEPLCGKPIIAFLFSGVLYSIAVLVIVLMLPIVFGLRRNDVAMFACTSLSLLKRFCV